MIRETCPDKVAIVLFPSLSVTNILSRFQSDSSHEPTDANIPTAPRRSFVKTSALLTGAAIAESMHRTSTTMAAFQESESDTLKIGLIGCGGRGTGAASQALMADSQVKLTAMGDVFDDRLQLSLKSLRRMKIQEVKSMSLLIVSLWVSTLTNGSLNATWMLCYLQRPPHFRPMQMEAAIAAGKHVFAEKPCAVDALGVHSVLRTCEEAKKKKLTVVSGFASAITIPIERPFAVFKTEWSARFVQFLQTIIVVLFGLNRVNRNGLTCIGRCITGTTLRGCQATSM